MSFELPALPYAKDALSPYMSSQTFYFHHEKHHQAYITNLNNLLKDNALAGRSLEEIILATHGKSETVGISNNATQVWNHSFFWNSMKPQGGGLPTGAIAEKINADFGSYGAFVTEFKTAGATQFGSGWAWLVLDNGKLKVVKTANAELPLTAGQTAILTIDVWEHAYYLDYQNRRSDFIATYLQHLVNWDFANANLAAAVQGAKAIPLLLKN